MDTGMGNFARISEDVAEKIMSAVPGSGVFCVGEELVIKDSRFCIQSIGKNKMKLKLLKGKLNC